jgi:hypothetical protein
MVVELPGETSLVGTAWQPHAVTYEVEDEGCVRLLTGFMECGKRLGRDEGVIQYCGRYETRSRAVVLRTCSSHA